MKILITDKIDEDGVLYLRNAGLDVEEKLELNDGELKDIISNYEGLIVRSRTKVTSEVIQAASNLLVIGRAGVGLDNIDLPSAQERKIKVLNTPDASSISVAELVMGFMISAMRHIPQATESVKTGKWEKKKFSGTELFGKTLGIVGTGRIGMALAKRAAAFEMRIIGYDPLVKSSDQIELVGYDKLLSESDVVSFHVPMNEKTHHMLSYEEIKKMKKGVVVINAARGGVVDEEAVKKGLDEGIIGAVALDTFESEKPFSTVLKDNDNLIATPHIGAQTKEAQKRAGTQMAKIVVDYLKTIE